jgi:hypothetical protein
MRCWWRSRRWYGIFAALLLLTRSRHVSGYLGSFACPGAIRCQPRRHPATFFSPSPGNRPIPSGIDLVAANPGFQDAALFDNHLVISARAGLYVYDTNGALLHWYRAGVELPSAELGPMSAGIAAGSTRPELFIATHGGGVLGFDGSQFRQVLPDDTAVRSITAVLALNSGRILLGTARKGLVVFDGRQLSPFPAQPKTKHITALAGTDGDLWVGTLADGVFHVHSGEWDNLRGALPDPQVLSLSIEPGRALVGTPLGVVEFRDGARTRSLAHGFFAKALAREPDDSLAIGTEDEGVVHAPLASNRTRRLSLSSDTTPVSPIRLALLGDDLYALADSSLFRFEPAQRTWRSVLTAGAPVLTDRNISALAVSSGRLWVGYFDRGLDLLPLDLEHAAHQESDTLFRIKRIADDSADARTAVATANGLALFDQNAQLRQIMTTKDGLLSDQITDVAFRDSGMVPGSVASWAGRYQRPSPEATFTVAGTREGAPLRISTKAALPETATDHPYLPRTWAKARVDALLSKIERDGWAIKK